MNGEEFQLGSQDHDFNPERWGFVPFFSELGSRAASFRRPLPTRRTGLRRRGSAYWADRPHGLTNEPREKPPIRTDVENALAQACGRFSISAG
jgi:hypothetical protein